MTELVFVVPGCLDQLTGGYLYDRHIIDGLRARGRAAKVIELAPKADHTEFAALADGTAMVIDGLAFRDVDRMVAAQARRLRFIALVHHPLAEETGLSSSEARRAA